MHASRARNILKMGKQVTIKSVWASMLCILGIFLLQLTYLTSSQYTVPPNQVQGIVISDGDLLTKDVKSQLEVFLDPLCPDSKTTWPAIKQLASSSELEGNMV